jgi:flavin-binding protein dodecin
VKRGAEGAADSRNRPVANELSIPPDQDWGGMDLVTRGQSPFGQKESDVAESVYKVIELVGTSTESWEKAAAAAVEMAAQSLRDLRIAEVAELDMQLEDGKVRAYRARVKVSFKYRGSD